MMTVDGLFGAGDTIGGTAHKFSSGSFTEGRIAAKAAVNYINDLRNDQPEVDEDEYKELEETVFQPMENYRGRPQRNRRRHGVAELSSCRCMGCSVSKRSWTNMSAASVLTTPPTRRC